MLYLRGFTVYIGNEYKNEAVGVYKIIGNSLDMASMRNSHCEIHRCETSEDNIAL